MPPVIKSLLVKINYDQQDPQPGCSPMVSGLCSPPPKSFLIFLGTTTSCIHFHHPKIVQQTITTTLQKYHLVAAVEMAHIKKITTNHQFLYTIFKECSKQQ